MYEQPYQRRQVDVVAMPAGSFFLQALVPDARLAREMPNIRERIQTGEDHLLAQGLEVEVVKTCKSELLLDVDSLLQGGSRLQERVEEPEAGELEGAAVVAAQHPWCWKAWYLAELICKREYLLSDSPKREYKRIVRLTHYELEADGLSKPESEH